MGDASGSLLRVSAILSVYNRDDVLRRCMECLASQRDGLSNLEVWVVGDGSPNEEAMRRAVQEPFLGSDARVRFENRPKLGPAAQRNWAIRQSTGDLLLFLNDDVEFDPDFLRLHLRAHRQQPGHAVVGNTRWHPGVVQSPFMHWVAHRDSFYYLIRDFSNVGWEYVHTLNLSVHRRWFDEEPDSDFSEDFPDPAFEDTEWGLRMGKRGMKMVFAPEAVLYHVHEYLPEQYWQKVRMQGKSARLLIERHPEVRDRILGGDPGWGSQKGRLLETVASLFSGGSSPCDWDRKAQSLFRKAALSSA